MSNHVLMTQIEKPGAVTPHRFPRSSRPYGPLFWSGTGQPSKCVNVGLRLERTCEWQRTHFIARGRLHKFMSMRAPVCLAVLAADAGLSMVLCMGTCGCQNTRASLPAVCVNMGSPSSQHQQKGVMSGSPPLPVSAAACQRRRRRLHAVSQRGLIPHHYAVRSVWLAATDERSTPQFMRTCMSSHRFSQGAPRGSRHSQSG